MKKSILFLALFLLSACLPVPAQQTPKETPALAQIPTLTATTTPTATIDNAPIIAALKIEAEQAQESARLAQLTSDAANRLLVDATVTHEAIQLAYSLQTVTAEQAALQYSVMTQQAGYASATAYATAFPATQTSQAKSDSIKSTALAMTINAPEQLREMTAAQTAAEYSWVEPFARVVLSISVFIFVIGFLYVSRAARLSIADVAENESERLEKIGLLPIPMAPKPSAPGTTMLAEIPCTWPRLELLAKGIVQEGKTMAINQWEKTIVHRSIVDLREYFLLHELAYELPNKRGELALTEEGNHFLMYCIESGEPPAPHVCQKLASPTA